MGKNHKKKRQPYIKPTATPIATEDAKQKLLALIRKGDRQAWEMFKEVFPEEAEKEAKKRKRSA